ncbi:uncharacterized protein [Coffea arabica]|uniref:Endonuclease/exonuclease/phosphatase domain-containing protein n=1 Tax=Coffea arabica TaxID=13443 RepID=A0ABM4UR34_COFAR
MNNKIPLVFFLEPMSEIKQLDVVRRGLKLDHGAAFLNGKIWCIWSRIFKLSFLEGEDQVVHARLSFQSGEVVNISAVYAKCTRVGRRPLWNCQEGFSVGRSEPWIVAGDFNVVASTEECRGGRSANVTNMEEFNTAMFTCGLSLVEFDGGPFTWTNGKVWQRLDRALVNSRWATAYAVTRVSHLPRGWSDHVPLLIKAGSGSSISHLFRYLNVWHHHPTFFELVSRVWQEPGSGVEMNLFVSKLASLRRQLRKWSKEFGNIFARVRSAKELYKQQEADFDSRGDDSSKIRLQEARALYLRELSVECEYWHQKAALWWIREGDSNTFFLNSVAKQRRNSNYISRVKDEASGWLLDMADIQASVVHFFSSLFKSSGYVPPPELPFELPRVELEEDEMLRRLPELEELRAVVFSMETNSAPGPDRFGVAYY